ncbi:restriction endonuclease subunit S [Bacillus wiedmannii]|uniref:restriction endonuclease subunit S n=1 Tax=Bacillus wiedmannii TaxID=1890302 RepID=UPI002FFFD46E
MSKGGLDNNQWQIRRLEEVVEILDGMRKPIKKADRVTGEIPYYGATGIIDWVKDYIFDEPLILVGEDGENLRSRVLPMAFKIQGKAWVNNHAHVLRPHKNVDIEYLTYYLDSISYEDYITGSAQPKLNQNQLRKVKVLLPHVREQQKVASILSSVDVAIEKTKAIIEQAEKVKKGLMQRLLKKGIGHERYKDTTIGSIPEDWDLHAFKDVCEIISGQVNPKVEPFASMLHIGSNNIEKFTGRILDCKTAKEEGVTSGKYLFTQEHVLFSKIRPELAKVAFPKTQGICSADIYPIKSKNGCMIPEFIKYVLLSKRFYEYSVSVSGRTGIPKVNRGDLEIFQIPVPSIDEQRKIVSILSEVERKAVNEQKRLREFQKIKKGLMQSLFANKVRVKVEGTEVTQV